MKKTYARVVREVVEKSDIILQVLDARLIDQTRNKNLEEEIQAANKKLINVINKSDLMPKEYLEKKKGELAPCAFISSKEKMGTSVLRELIYRVAAKAKNAQIFVGVVGYPNTGKSSVINALRGHSSASVSSQSGHTKGTQFIRISERILLIDTPGVIPIEEQDEAKLAILASKNPDRIESPDLVAQEIIQNVLGNNNGKSILEKRYNIIIAKEDPEEILTQIAIARNKFLKGRVPDIMTVGRQVVQEWQKGILSLHEITKNSQRQKKK